jgi:uncharacterized membrane protein
MEKHRWTHEEIAEYRSHHNSPFYFNKDDSRIFVPKYIGIGITLNWANPLAYVSILAIIAIIIGLKYLIKA